MNRNTFLKTLGLSAAAIVMPDFAQGAVKSEYIASPWPEYNAYFGGFKKGESVMISGARRTGKSTILRQIHCATKGPTFYNYFFLHLDNEVLNSKYGKLFIEKIRNCKPETPIFIDNLSCSARLKLDPYLEGKTLIYTTGINRCWVDHKGFVLENGILKCLKNRNGQGDFSLKI